MESNSQTMFYSYKLSVLKLTLLFSISFLIVSCSSPTKYTARDSVSNKESNVKAMPSVNACKSPYKVKSGDTLSEIAHRCDSSVKAIAKENHLLPPYIIYVKQELFLPTKSSSDYSHRIKPKSMANPSQNDINIANPKPNIKLSESASKAKGSLKSKPKEVTAKAITRPEPKTAIVKSKSTKKQPWVWPMHKGLSYRFLRDHAGLYVLEVYGVPGQKVKAVANGKVVYSGNGIINYGWMLVIKHDNDYMSIYAHNSALLVKEGDTVEAGQYVATMGGTGNTKRPKLYLEARYQGRKVDIKKVLKYK
ncbi:peptidoglycan DD-metalloendopeptidase family protein [Thiomicrorhabdus lithotrophica]|uniref:M23 family metallopeptidase n=1 Tax=Thiomicrorhabdus lithotrophica TaxID=2949997 RepID=A0ABY8CA33_9GAMM|nr:M23 family metallopeptidase [Thiomicrorhabdus lithotrophica]WEJ61545.1 M23 family metallopeptidase [Thiomicrorhabdus lithotrophica]